jgi:hypothetical protein
MEKINRRDALRQTALILGYAVSASSIAGVMAGCQANTSSTNHNGPTVLAPPQMDLVAALAERILPKTADSPGANEANVQQFVDAMLGDYMQPEEAEMFLKGLDDITTRCMNAHGKTFVELSEAEQDALLTELAADTPAQGASFWGKMRELTILGYFTSELVGREHLKYDPIPGEYIGCIPLSDTGGVNWTL